MAANLQPTPNWPQSPICEEEGCPRRGKIMWHQRLLSLAVKNSSGRMVTIFCFRCVSSLQPFQEHLEYQGPHGEVAERVGNGVGPHGGRYLYTDSTTKESIETECSHARAMGSLEVSRKLSEAQDRRWTAKARKQKGKVMRTLWKNDRKRHEQQSDRTKEWWAEQRARLSAALPDGWKDKSDLSLIIGILLLTSPPDTLNAALAQRLDALGLKCQYGPAGASWVEMVDDPACKGAIKRIRNWIERPGRQGRKPR